MIWGDLALMDLIHKSGSEDLASPRALRLTHHLLRTTVKMAAALISKAYRCWIPQALIGKLSLSIECKVGATDQPESHLYFIILWSLGLYIALVLPSLRSPLFLLGRARTVSLESRLRKYVLVFVENAQLLATWSSWPKSSQHIRGLFLELNHFHMIIRLLL